MMAPGDLAQYLPTILTGLGGLGGGGLIVKLLDHRRAARKQTDEVALALVAKLEARVQSLEAEARKERKECDDRLSALRHELRNFETAFDALILALKHAPEKAQEIVADIQAQRMATPRPATSPHSFAQEHTPA
jgi:hypothetical protein